MSRLSKVVPFPGEESSASMKQRHLIAVGNALGSGPGLSGANQERNMPGSERETPHRRGPA